MQEQPPQQLERTPTSPRFNCRPLTPDDNRTVKQMFGVDVVNLSIATAGNVHFVDGNGKEDTAALPVGVFPVWFRKVFATGTTAEGLAAIW